MASFLFVTKLLNPIFIPISYKYLHVRNISFINYQNALNKDGDTESLPIIKEKKYKNRQHPLPISKKSPNYHEREQKFICRIMRDGKKLEAYQIYVETLKILEELIPTSFPELQGDDKLARTVFFKALDNLRPVIQMNEITIRGAKKKIPFALNDQRADFLATKNLMNALFSKLARISPTKIANEIIQAYKGKGAAYERKKKIHREAESYKGFGR